MTAGLSPRTAPMAQAARAGQDRHSESLRSLAVVAAEREPILLAEVMSEAALQTRVDRKFLLSPDELTRLAALLGQDFRALEIGPRRVFEYESVYFDTPELEQFRAHRQGRRRRYKVRTRTYVDSGLCMFEVKFKGHRGETVKHRMPYQLQDSSRLTAAAEEFLAAQLSADYGLTLPRLQPSLATNYTRGTLVNPTTRERLTCDVDLVFGSLDQPMKLPDLVVVETKTMDGFGAADQALASMGIRPVSMSKYCLGIALLHPELPANRWNRVLRAHFGWSRVLPEQTGQGRH